MLGYQSTVTMYTIYFSEGNLEAEIQIWSKLFQQLGVWLTCVSPPHKVLQIISDMVLLLQRAKCCVRPCTYCWLSTSNSFLKFSASPLKQPSPVSKCFPVFSVSHPCLCSFFSSLLFFKLFFFFLVLNYFTMVRTMTSVSCWIPRGETWDPKVANHLFVCVERWSLLETQLADSYCFPNYCQFIFLQLWLLLKQLFPSLLSPTLSHRSFYQIKWANSF